ncbi:MAG TPA: hypothetical protein VNL16_00070 [Chloroflexota bacterium]|nr:hypothetical protein [Chloroflexota bacterium]
MMKSDFSGIPTPLLEAFRVLGIEPIDPDPDDQQDEEITEDDPPPEEDGEQ